MTTLCQNKHFIPFLLNSSSLLEILCTIWCHLVSFGPCYTKGYEFRRPFGDLSISVPAGVDLATWCFKWALFGPRFGHFGDILCTNWMKCPGFWRPFRAKVPHGRCHRVYMCANRAWPRPKRGSKYLTWILVPPFVWGFRPGRHVSHPGPVHTFGQMPILP